MDDTLEQLIIAANNRPNDLEFLLCLLENCDDKFLVDNIQTIRDFILDWLDYNWRWPENVVRAARLTSILNRMELLNGCWKKISIMHLEQWEYKGE